MSNGKAHTWRKPVGNRDSLSFGETGGNPDSLSFAEGCSL